MLTLSRTTPAIVRRQRGLSLVELMVGIALGMIVVAATALMVSSQLSDNRRLLTETQLQQDMRVTLNTITRELRRLGFKPSMAGELWSEDKPNVAENNMANPSPGSGTGRTEVNFDYARRPGEEGGFAFKLDAGVVKMKVQSALQAMTDARTMEVVALAIDWDAPTVYQLPCPQICTGASATGCWPEVRVRTLTVTLTARSVADPNVVRTMSSRVRIRNDWTKFNGATACPA